MTRRILVALDGSPASESALSEVERISMGGAGVHFLYVVPLLPPNVGLNPAGVMVSHDRALTYLRDLREKLPEVRGLDLIRTGDPAAAILQAAREFDIDLIAMGAQVRSGPSNGFLGSLAETVLREAQAPVLLRRVGGTPASPKLRRILVPLDGSEESLSILPAVKDLALHTGAELLFLHLPARVPALAPLPGAPAAEDPKARGLRLTALLGKSDVVFRQTIAEGDAVEEILTHAERLNADLIAMTTQANGSLEDTSVGNAALTVVGRTDRTVLLRRPGSRAAAPKPWMCE